MSNDGKHHFHLKEYSILQLMHSRFIIRFGSVLHTLLKMKNKANLFIFFTFLLQKNIDVEILK